jgi:hypothetical protein
VPSSSSHSLLTFPSSSLQFHNISSVPSTTLDIQRFLKPFTITSGEMCYHAVMIYIHWIIHLCILAYKLTWTLDENSQYSPKIVLVVLRILNTCVLDFCFCGLISLSSWLFLWFLIYGWVQVLFLSLVVNFQFLNSHFPVTTLGLDLFSWVYRNKLLCVWCPVN